MRVRELGRDVRIKRGPLPREIVAAESVTFDVVVPEGENEPFIGMDDVPVGLLPPRAAIDYPMVETFRYRGSLGHRDAVD